MSDAAAADVSDAARWRFQREKRATQRRQAAARRRDRRRDRRELAASQRAAEVAAKREREVAAKREREVAAQRAAEPSPRPTRRRAWTDEERAKHEARSQAAQETTDPTWAEVERFIDEHPGGATLEEVGAAFGLTRERVRQIEQRAIAHLLAAWGAAAVPAAWRRRPSVAAAVGRRRENRPSDRAAVEG